MRLWFFVGALVPIIIVLAVAAIAYSIYASAKRRKELAAWAQSHGLSFQPLKHYGIEERFGQFKCLGRGQSRYAQNIMEGELFGLAMTAFDYHYSTGSGKNRSDHYFSAVVAASPIALKPLYIRRERFFDKLTEFVGFDDIDFESAEFSRKFYVKSPDKRWAYDVIHQRMMEYLLASPEFAVQFDGPHIMAWRSRTIKPADFQAAAEHLRGILDRLPQYLVRQQSE